jgi:tRNA pseudouridine55 synthase
MTQATCDGLIVLDKPKGMTSRAAVDRAARWFPRRTRIGHTGTLDPLATGVLVVCVGNATRLAEYVQRMSKTYRSRFRLGARSDTNDADGVVTPMHDVTPPEARSVAARLREFVGTIAQVPPAFSAAKVTGRRAYSLARQGEEVQLQARPVQIYAIDVIRYEYPTLDVEVHCGKGTYIRSLARDLGERLGCGAFVQELRRTRVGPFTAEAAVPLDTAADVARSRMLPVEMAVGELAQVTLAPADARRLCQGQAVGVVDLPVDGLETSLICSVAVFDAARHLVAVAEYDAALRLLRPTKVLAPN